MKKTPSRPARPRRPDSARPPPKARDTAPAKARLAELNQGRAETTNLAECLAVDQSLLARAVLPALGLKSLEADAVQLLAERHDAGILRRMEALGTLLARALEDVPHRTRVERALREHPSDTVRGWAAFAVGAARDLPLPRRLEAIRPFADDRHFGVREWAWMAVRPFLAAELPLALSSLRAWCDAPSEYLRRFAVESTRPRGVWCAHLQALKDDPARAEPLLERLKADESRYVQDSVANWLNDASKSQPQWVRALCERWGHDAPPSTQRIVQRAQRTLRKQEA